MVCNPGEARASGCNVIILHPPPSRWSTAKACHGSRRGCITEVLGPLSSSRPPWRTAPSISFSSLLAAPLHMSFIGLSYGYVFQRLPCCASSEIKECSWAEKLISNKVVLHFDHTHHSPLCTDYKPVFHFPASIQEVQWKFYG